MCVRACSQGDGRGVGRSMTAWETGVRSVGYPGAYSPTYVLRPVRCYWSRACFLITRSKLSAFQHPSVAVPHNQACNGFGTRRYSFPLQVCTNVFVAAVPGLPLSSMISICCSAPILLTLVSAPARSPCSADVSRRSIGYCSRQGSCLICA